MIFIIKNQPNVVRIHHLHHHLQVVVTVHTVISHQVVTQVLHPPHIVEAAVMEAVVVLLAVAMEGVVAVVGSFNFGSKLESMLDFAETYVNLYKIG